MQKIRSLYLSDTHLGSKYSQTKKIYETLIKYNPENLFILGDFIDAWRINKGFKWDAYCGLIVKRIIDLANNGTVVTYIRGNHDDIDPYLFYLDLHENIIITDKKIWEVNGRKILLLHGDQFDDYCKHYPILYTIGDFFYCIALDISYVLKKRFKLQFSISRFLKNKMKRVQGFINHFEDRASEYCKGYGCQEIMMGHIHHPAINKEMNGIKYHNTGDFVEVCSYIIETEKGLELKFVS